MAADERRQHPGEDDDADAEESGYGASDDIGCAKEEEAETLEE
jgi:hypothetical protein